MGNHDKIVGDWIGCFSPGGKSLSWDLGNHDKKVGNYVGKCSGQTNK